MLFLIIFLAGCDRDESFIQSDGNTYTLLSYIRDNPNLQLSNELIACAAGGQIGYLDDLDFPVSVFFLPINGAIDLRYFEAGSVNIDKKNFSLYVEKDFKDVPIFNGFLRRYKHPGAADDVWGRVTFTSANRLHISNAIRIKVNSKPTEFNPDLLHIDLTVSTEPLFTWEDGIIKENAIYFQVISDEQENLISGTYTYDKHFRFYDLSNVVININDVNPPPILVTNRDYTFTLMGISEDNWVNLIIEKEFTTN